jgi:hypothetical protein
MIYIQKFTDIKCRLETNHPQMTEEKVSRESVGLAVTCRGVGGNLYTYIYIRWPSSIGVFILSFECFSNVHVL